jgi:hypothetical protein
MIVEPFEGDGLSFLSPTTDSKMAVHFDEKQYPDQGAGAQIGSTSSAKRLNPRHIQFAGEVNGKLDGSGDGKVSENGTILTMTYKNTNADEPFVDVYGRKTAQSIGQRVDPAVF